MDFGTGGMPPMSLSGVMNNLIAQMPPELRSQIPQLNWGGQGTGVIDPNSVVNGIGLGATNVPKPPDAQLGIELNQLQQDHTDARKAFISEMQGDVQDKRDLFLATHHFEFDDNGKPQLGDDGNPKIFDGAESAEQAVRRRRWERKETLAVRDSFAPQEQGIKQKFDDLTQWAQANPQMMTDPQARAQYMEQVTALQEEQNQLQTQETFAVSQGPYGFMPDPDNEGQTIGNFVDSKRSAYDTMVSQQKADEEANPAKQAWTAYEKEMTAYVEAQQAQMAQYMQQSGMNFDPNAMRTFGRQQGLS